MLALWDIGEEMDVEDEVRRSAESTPVTVGEAGLAGAASHKPQAVRRHVKLRQARATVQVEEFETLGGKDSVRAGGLIPYLIWLALGKVRLFVRNRTFRVSSVGQSAQPPRTC